MSSRPVVDGPARDLQAVNAISEVLGRSRDLDGLLSGVLEELVGALGAAGGFVRLRDADSGACEIHAELGPPELALLWRNDASTCLPASAADAGLALDTGGAGSRLTLPLVLQDTVIGTVGVVARASQKLDDEDARLMGIVARQIAGVVQNTRLHDMVRRGKRQWEDAFDAIGDPIAVFDSRGGLLRGNHAMSLLLGQPVSSMPNATCGDVGFCSGAFPQCAVADAVFHGAAGRAEVTRPDGQIFTVTTFPVSGEDGGASVVQVAKNVTEEIRSARRLRQMSEELTSANGRLTATVAQLKSTQAQLLQAEKLSAIGQLVAGVAHELNNPLTSVIGYAQLLDEEVRQAVRAEGRDVPRGLTEDLRRIVDEAERAARIVRNLLAFARRQTAERAPQDLVELVTRVLALRAYELRLNDIDLQTTYEPGLPPIVADGGQIQQALLNLVLNAEQAMRGRPTRRLTVSVAADVASATVELRVSDTGHGIAQANLTRIFDPFFTTRDVGDGTGLGLSICYGIIRGHGGQIEVESQVDAGTTFSVVFPARLAEPVDTAPVLVACADHADREFLGAALAGWGYAVESAAQAHDAVARCRSRRIQRLLVDRGFVGADIAGWAAMAEAAGSPPLVLLSRDAEDAERDRFTSAQVSTVLTPPFALRGLRAAVAGTPVRGLP